MKLKNYLYLLPFFLVLFSKLSAQTVVPFSSRLPTGNVKIKGDIIYVGNSILGSTTSDPAFNSSGIITNQATLTTQANTAYDVAGDNNNKNFEYIDVDGDATTFSSSTANLNITSFCKKIVFAGLYWTATYPYDRTRNNLNYEEGNTTTTPRFSDWNQVKFKVPGGNYVDIIADNNADAVGDEDQIIFNGYNFYAPANNPVTALGTKSFKDAPYVCYKNITSLVNSLADANGIYAIANMRASKGKRDSGSCGGWTMVIIYESSALTSKYISVFDGFSAIENGFAPVDFAVNGFQTLPAPLPVKAVIGAVSLEGDLGLDKDSFSIKANSKTIFSPISNTINATDNFFNSTISNNDVVVMNRNPASVNTLGFDMDMVAVNNASNLVVPNGETGATLRLSTTKDSFSTHLTTFAVEIIEPKITLTKIVTDNLGNAIGPNVVLGQQLNYIVGFQNIGNENANNFTIKDVLPDNIIFNYPTDLTLPAGVSSTYNPVTKTLIFTIPNGLVEKNDPRYEIFIKVKVVPTCYELSTACSNIIKNQAFSTYSDPLNSIQITDDPSYATYSACLPSTPAPTNFIVGLDGCEFRKTEVLCGANLTLTAASGYSSYSWSTNSSGTPVIGTSQTLVVTVPGTYYVSNTIASPCVSIKEIVTVIPFGNNVTNPVIPFADEVVICPNDGKQLPNIFLCGINDSQLIQTNIQDAVSISWQRLTVGSCPVLPNAFCANENTACTWTSVGTQTNYLANSSGQYRIVINYQGGCFNIFYFNVYQNTLNPTAATRDIICTSSGNITVNNVPSGYEYSFTTANVPGAYGSSNIFNTNTAGAYNVFIRQTGVGANACIFQILGLPIVVKNFTATIITLPIECDGDKATIKVAANNILPQYTFTLRQGTTVISTSGLTNVSDFTFTGIDAGTYTVTTTSQDGCTNTQTVVISAARALGLIATLTQPLTPCSDAIVTLTASGGNGIYEYKEGTNNGIGTYRPGNVFIITTPGLYTFQVDDTTKCDTGITTLNITLTPAPVFTISQSNIKCYAGNNGQIAFNVSNSNGYTIQYSINGGATYLSSNTFTNLAPGTYPAMLQYAIGSASPCSTAIQNIVIAEPSLALTASGGVSAVACDTNGGLGTIRITNPQGGTAPYQYNLGAGYSASNTRQVAPGNYTISIRDANLCVFTMNVVVDPIPQIPTIGIQSPVFNCNGSATTTVIVNNGPSNYAYTYSNNGILNTPPSNNVFSNVTCGLNTFSVNYQLTSVTTYSNLLFESFGSGPPTTTPGIAGPLTNPPFPGYCFNDQRVNPPYLCGTRSVEDGQYSVASFFWRGDDPLSNNTGAWFHYPDHTNPTDINGRMLIVNIGGAAGPNGILYSKPINDVIPNQPVIVDIYLANLLRVGINAVDPDFILELVTLGGVVVASQGTGVIDNTVDAWQLKTLALNPGNNTSLIFRLRSGSTETGGNDAAIDDIKVFQLPVTCLNQRVFPTDIPCGKAFAAQITSVRNISCAGANDGQITIAAQNFRFPQGYDYSIDNGATWTNVNFSPVTISGIGPGNYQVNIRFDAAVSSCNFVFSQPISTPTALISSASVTTPATCLTGAIITASATGGTTPFQYQLTNAAGTTVIRGYQTPLTFSNVPAGNYLVFIRDANGCIDPINSPITVSPAIAPSATISVTSNYCVSGSGGATLIVNATGGRTPYEYSNNNGASFQSSNTFVNVVPGTYTIIVRDAAGCRFTLPVQTIAPQLSLNAVLTKDLDCTTSPNAVVTGTIGGGYAGFTYTIKYNTDPTSAPIAVTGTTFSYATAAAGTYLFTVTDSRGCTTQATQVINVKLLPTATTTVVNISCTISTGTVTINASGGNPAYLYSFNGSAYSTNTIYANLPAGTYLYKVKDIKECVFDGSVTVTRPTLFLSASAGVSELACTTTNTGNGKIRVTNPQNGTPPYEYNFNNTGYQTLKEATLPPGTYSILIKDALGCVFAMSATIDPVPVAPTVTLASPTYNCDGTSTSIITVNSGLVNYTYSYFIDGALNTNTPPNIFTNVSCGRHVITTNYQLTVPPLFSNLLTETFGSGSYTLSPGINPAYCFENQGPQIPNRPCDNSQLIDDGQYAVTSIINPTYVGAWTPNAKDHTNPISDPNGRFLAVNIGGTAGIGGILYSKQIFDIIPNRDIKVSLWYMNLLVIGNTQPNPNLTIQLIKDFGLPSETIISSQDTGDIPKTEAWINNILTLNPGANTSLLFVVRSNINETSGNDIIIDDIEAYQLPLVCVNTVNFPILIPCNQAFAAQVTNVQNVTCNGVPNGQLTINAQNFNLPYGFDYSTNNGTSWTNSKVSPVVVTGLSAITYDVKVRFNDVSVGCTFSATPTISQPTALFASATVTTQATCLTGATITASGSGGVVPYQYQLTDSAGTEIRPYQSGTTFTNVPVGNYLVNVRDANTCIDPINAAINVAGPIAVSASIAAISNYCISGSTGANLFVNATGGTGIYQYSINGNTFQSSNTFSNLGFGTYNIIVRDTNGCTFPIPTQTVQPQLNVSTVLTKDLDCTANSSATITGTIGGGYAGFTYTIKYNSDPTSAPITATGTTFSYATAAAGTYLFTVTDSRGCTTQATQVINVKLLPSATTTVENISCTVLTGTVTINASGGNPAYLYSFNGSGFTSNTTYTGLAAGSYNYIVKDIKQCEFASTVIVTQPAVFLTASAGVLELACATNNGNGIIRVTNPQNGTAPYQYNFNNTNFQNLNQATVAPGSYNILIKDALGCVFAMSATIDPIPTAPTVTLASPTYNCDGTSTSVVTVNSVIGNYTYSYLLDGILNTNTPPNIFTNVSCGSHVISTNYEITTPPSFSNLLFEDFGSGANTTSPGINPAYCFNNQQLPYSCSANPSLYLGDNEYVVTSGLNPNYLGAWFDFRDHTSNGTNPQGRFLAVNIGGAAGPNGVLYSKVINDVLPNQPILIEAYLANYHSDTFTGQASPSFLFEITTIGGVTIASDTSTELPRTNTWLQRSFSLNPGANTSLIFNVRSGSTEYVGNDAAIDDIKVYQLPKVCVNTVNFLIDIDCNQAFTAQVSNIQNVTCNGVSNGQMTINAQNFIPANGFQYSIDNGVTYSTSTVSPVIITGLSAATYNVNIRFDSVSAGCAFASTQTITQPDPVIASATITSQATCLVGATIVASAIGGTNPYQYQLTTASGTTVVAYQDGTIFTNVLVGSYLVSVKDRNGCIDPINAPIDIIGATAISASIAASSTYCAVGTAGATLVVNATGGTGLIEYSLNGISFQTSNTFSNLGAGTYNIIVRDSFGCTFSLPSQTIQPQITVGAIVTKDLDCTTLSNATISVNIGNGYPGYSYQISFNGGALGISTPVSGTSFVYNTTAAGNYQFIVTDNKGCTAQSAIIRINLPINPTATTTQVNATCGNNNGSFTISATSGESPYSYAFNGSTTFTAVSAYSGLASGNYTYQVRDTKFCTVSGSVTITSALSISGTANIATPYTCSGTASIEVQNVSGGTPAYMYSIDGTTFQSGTTFSGLVNGTYNVTIKDSNNCTFVTNAVIIAPLNPPTDLAFAQTPITCPSNTTDVTITTTGVNTPFTYQIIAPATAITATQTSNVFVGLSPNSYIFLVTDSKNCTYQENLTINPITPIAVLGQPIANVQCFGSSTGAVRFTISGFSTTYNYTVSNGASGTTQSTSTVNLTNLLAGNYTISVTDNSTNCVATATAVVSPPAAPLAISSTITPITCVASGAVTANVTGGWGGNNFTLTPPAGPVVGPRPTATFTNLTAIGTYTISTTDQNNCTVSATFTLNPPETPTAIIASSATYCIVGNVGASLVITATGGVAPYEYNINGGLFQSSNVFSALLAQDYSIIVRGANGCEVTVATTTIAPQLSLSTSLKGLDCTNNPDALISGSISGGYAPFTVGVTLNGNPSTPVSVSGTTFAFATAATGDYIFTVTDSKGCVSTSERKVLPITNPQISSVSQTTQILCNGGSTGALNIVINSSFGTPPFAINVQNTTTLLNYGTQTSGLAAGDYIITVTDAKSCTSTRNVTILEPALIEFTVVKQDITCTGGTGLLLGQICVSTLTGGVAPYQYILSNNLNDPANPTQNFTSVAGANHCFTILNFGIYELNVVDSNGCTIKKANIIMASPPDDLIVNVSTPTTNCISGGTVTVSVNPAFAGGPYFFAIYQNPYPPYSSTSTAWQPESATGTRESVFTNLLPGVTYSFVVYDDATKCYYFKQSIVPVPTLSTLQSNISVINNVTCNGSANANVSFSFSNYTANSVSYQIYNSTSNTAVSASTTINTTSTTSTTITNVGNLPPGTYYILFSENDGTNGGCTNASNVFAITQSAIALTLTATSPKNDNCNLNAGQVSIVAQGGTAPYTYQLLPIASATPTTGYVSNPSFNAEAGTYTAYVKDANGCIKSTDVSVVADPSPAIALVVNNQCTASQGQFSIDVNLTTAGIAPYSYSLNGDSFQPGGTPFTFSNLTSGTQTITVQDANGCSSTTSVVIFAPLLNSPAFTTAPVCEINNGVITVSTQGGSGNFTYAISPNVGITAVNNVFSAVSQGTYIITVNDLTTGCSVTNTAFISAPTPVTFTTIVDDVSCNGGANGIITVNLSAVNTNGPYTYQLNNITPQNTNTFGGLLSATYTITVTSARGCSETIAIFVGQPSAVSVSATATAFVCNSNNAPSISTVTLTAFGGTGAYFYSIDSVNYFSGNAFQVPSTGATQTIIVSAKDVNSCVASTQISIAPLSTITAASVTRTTAAINCFNLSETVSVTAIGGLGNYSYQILPSGPINNTGIFTLSTPTTYTFLITDTSTGCTINTTYEVPKFDNVVVTATQSAPVLCFGENSGAISMSVANYSGSYTYDVLNASNAIVASGTGNTTTNPQSVTGLLAGNYTVIVRETDAPFCTKTSNVVNIGSPAVVLTNAIVSNVNANCNTDAQVLVQGSGGTSPYSYAFVTLGSGIPLSSAYSTSATANLNPTTSATWTVYVKDVNNCIASTNVTVVRDPQPTISLPPFADNQCTSTGNSFTFTAVPTGLTPFTYSIGGTFQASPTFTVSSPGLYTVTVKDVNGCVASATINIYEPLINSPIASTLTTCANNDGAITVVAQGGSGLYSYTINPNVGTLTGNVFSGLPANTYAVTLTDTLTSCSLTTNVTIDPPTQVTFTTTVNNVTCSSGTNGVITVNLPLSNNNPNYTYQRNGGTPQFSNVFTGLIAGSYDITVNSGRGCSATQTVFVDQPTQVIVSASATAFVCDSNNVPSVSNVTLTAVNGTPNYTYSINGTNYGINNVFQIIDTGVSQTIVVYAKDLNGCIASSQVTISPLPTITAVSVSRTTAITCASTEIITINVIGGSGNFSYQLYPSGPFQPSPIFSISTTGIYRFLVRDNTTDCTRITAPYIILPFDTATVIASQQAAVNCFGEVNGSINVNVSGYSGNYNYALLNASSAVVVSGTTNTTTNPLLLSGLAAGDYTVQITQLDSPFCPKTSNLVNIGSSIAPVSVSIVSNVNANCNTGAQVTVQGTGGTAPYGYAFVTIGATPPLSAAYTTIATTNLNPATSATWTVYVRDANGCVESTNVTIVTEPQPTVTLPPFADNQCLSTGTGFTFMAVGTGLAPLTYSIGSAFQASSTFTVTTAGLYTVTVKDSNGCVASSTIRVYAPLINTLTATVLPTCANNDGVITVNAQGGSGDYSFVINPMIGTQAVNVFSGLPADTYTVTLTDNITSCSLTSTVILGVPTQVTFTTTVNDVTCSSGTNGVITVSLPASNDNPNYTYQIGTSTPTFSNVFNNLSAGDYIITVNSGRGCSASVTVTVAQPTPISVSATATDFVCDVNNAPTTATITLTAVGGTPGYTYSIDGSNYNGSNIFQILNTGATQTIVVYARDLNGCEASTASLIISPLKIISAVSVSRTAAITCINPEKVEILVTGGSGNYNYQLGTSGTPQASNEFILTASGIYRFQVIDMTTGCTAGVVPYLIEPVSTATVVASQVSAITCFGQVNGTINVNVSGYTGVYNYNLINASNVSVASGTTNTSTNPLVLSGFAAGDYSVIVEQTNAPFCTITDIVNIGTPAAPLSIAVIGNINANCNTGANVTVLASGGTASYTYAFVIGGAIPTPAQYTAAAFANLNPVTSTSWDIWVKDANGCPASTNVIIIADPQPTVTNTTAINANCLSDGNSYIVTVAGTGIAPLSYNIGNGPQSATTFTVTAPGNYIVTITDGNGCTAQTASITVLPILQVGLSIVTLPSCINGDGIILVNAQGGSGNYEYQIDALAFQPASSIINVTSGNHTITVRDITSGCIKSATITISVATAVTLNAATVQNVTCFNGSDGSITVNLAPTAAGINDNPTYSYSISGTVTRPVQFSNVFANLPEGSYTISVLSGRACVATQTADIIDPDPIIVPNAVVTQFGCITGSNAPNFATISLSGVTGGSGIYNIYQFIRNGIIVQSSSATTFIEANFSGANYSIAVFDNKGCVGTTTASSVINPFISISDVVVTVNNAVTCLTLERITVTVSASSGTPTLNYTVTGLGASTYNQSNTTGSFNGLAIGDYQITITNPATGCSIRTFHYVTNPNTFALTVQNLTDVICYDSNEGSVSLTFVDLQPLPVNSAGGFSYIISGPTPSSGTAATAGPITISNLRAGTYSVTATLTGSPQCPATFGFTIQQSDIPLTVTAFETANVTCENNKGAIVANANGGWPGAYQYALSGAATVSFSNNYLFDNLEAGNYTISARDSKGCTVSTTITLSVPTAISASISTNAPSVACFGAETGSITVSNTAGGQGSGYLYTLNYLSYTPTRKSGPVASNVFTGLRAGDYSVTVRDGYKCETTLPATITEPTKVKADLSISSLQTCENPAVLTLTGSGGTPPYTYSTNGTNFSTVTFTTSTTIAVPSGVFNYYIKDANGCVSLSNNAINPDIVPLTVDISSSVTTVNCTNDATGSIIAKANGGVGLGNYSYILQNITTGINLPAQASGIFNGLSAGTYVVQVTSDDCSRATDEIIITQPATALSFNPIKTDVTCFGAGDGKVVIIPSGGTGPYIYAISPNLSQFSTSNTYSNLAVRDYEMIIQDANGCKESYLFKITQPDPLTSALRSIDQQERCFNDRTGAFTIQVTGGTLPYRYSVDLPTGPFVNGTANQTIFSIVGQTGGTHTVYVLDANGCTPSNLIVAMSESVDIRAIAIPKYYCPDDSVINDVTVTVNSALIGQVEYRLDGAPYQPNNVFTNLSVGTHIINVRHTNGCVTPDIVFNITAVSPLIMNLVQGGLNEILAITSGGYGGYTYTINGGNSNTAGSFIIDTTATYTVTVTDSNGCDTSATIPIEFIDIFIPNVFTPNGDGNNDGWTPQNTFNYKNLVYYIFDRYGRKIRTGREGELWDGTYNGAELPSGDYWYVIKVDGESGNGREFVGNVTLYR